MSLLFWGLTFGMVGKILLAVGILKVHYVMAKERGIDDKVIHSFHFEKLVTFAGVALIVSGYLMELYFYNGAHLLNCWGSECAGAAIEAIAPR